MRTHWQGRDEPTTLDRPAVRNPRPTEQPMFKTAKEVLALNDTVQTVDLAVELNREVARLSKELDTLKAALRDQGVAAIAQTGNNNVTLAGTVGEAQVVAVKAAPKARKGIDLLSTEGNLPAEVWNSLFVKVTKVEIAPDFEVKVAGLTTAQKAVVNDLVEVVAQTPRVNIK